MEYVWYTHAYHVLAMHANVMKPNCVHTNTYTNNATEMHLVSLTCHSSRNRSRNSSCSLMSKRNMFGVCKQLHRHLQWVNYVMPWKIHQLMECAFEIKGLAAILICVKREIYCVGCIFSNFLICIDSIIDHYILGLCKSVEWNSLQFVRLKAMRYKNVASPNELNTHQRIEWTSFKRTVAISSAEPMQNLLYRYRT